MTTMRPEPVTWRLVGVEKPADIGTTATLFRHVDILMVLADEPAWSACSERSLLGAFLARLTGAEAPSVVAVDGKPSLPDHPGLHFSVTHSAGRCAIAFARRPVGLDMEAVVAKDGNRGVERQFFHAAERALLADMREPVWTAQFYRVWTRKEAVAKCVGLGVFLEFAEFSAAGETARFEDPDFQARYAGIACRSLAPRDGMQLSFACL